MLTTPTTRRRGRRRGLEAAAQRLRRGRASSRRSRTAISRSTPNWSTCSPASALIGQTWTVSPASLRNAAHRVAMPSTRRSSACAARSPRASPMCRSMASRRTQHYQLIVADADGENPQVILDSRPAADVAGLVARRRNGWRTCRSRAASRRCTCRTCAPASAAASRRAPASTARPAGRPTARSSRSRSSRQQRQPRHLSARPHHPAADAAHRRSRHRHRGGLRAGRQHSSTSRPTAPAARRSTGSGSAAANGPSASPSPARTMRGRAFRRTASSSRWSRSTTAGTASPCRTWRAARCTSCRRAARTNRRASRPMARW